MIRVHELSFRYPHATTEAVDSLSFEVAPGEIFGFLGPSGAGKSTTQKILIGLLRGYQGEAEIMGQSMKKSNDDFYEKIGISFEFPNIYTKLTALENLMFFAAMYRRATASPMELLEMVGLGKVANQRAEEFSKGMRMRLNFARAFLCQPQLIFLDEPTSGQDPNNARRIKDIILEKRAAGTTVFLTTHDMALASELCDRVAFIVNGRVTLIDSPRKLQIRYGQPILRVDYRAAGQSQIANFPLEGIGQNEEYLDLISNNPVEAMHSMEASLEEIFIKTTGQALQEDI